MMILKVLEKEDAEKQPIYLKLRQMGDEVDVITVDKNGNLWSWGYLLRFCNDGRIYLCSIVNPNLGFKLNDDGQIEIRK